ncbi:MAG: hypothetical protein KDA92_07205 [Planctomycetales bacterium]|nr:hypothetical protein [Planctomycetales bacterium]MCA9169485.1 hypothetical protein [Planctomycetales bacterium]
MRHLIVSVVCAAYCFFSPDHASAARFVAVPTLPIVIESRTNGISAQGDMVVGELTDGANTRGFVWRTDESSITLLDALNPPLSDSAAASIASNGLIAGYSAHMSGNEAVRWSTTSEPLGLGDLGSGFAVSSALDLSNNGAVVIGTGSSSSGREAFRWSESGGLTGLGFLPDGVTSEATSVSADGSIIVGTSETFDAILGEAFRWTANDGMVGLGDLPGGDRMSRAWRISADGSTIVGEASSTNGQEAMRWTSEHGMQGLGDLDGGLFRSVAYDVTADGAMIVGAGTTASSPSVAFVWTARDGMRAVSEMLANDYRLGPELEGWDLWTARAISDDGQVMSGTGVDPAGNVRAWLAELDGMRQGDFDGDGQLGVDDVGLLFQAIRLASFESQFDLNGDGQLDSLDRDYLVHDLMHTHYGDVNLDGQFGSSDLISVFVAGQYEDGVDGNSTWRTGDWNGDQEFDTSDLVLAFQDGGYDGSADALPRQVPEPSSMHYLLVAGTLGLAFLRRR